MGTRDINMAYNGTEEQKKRKGIKTMAKYFENAKTEVQGVYYSRYIASWKNAGGNYFGEQFRKWLRTNCCTEREIADICEMATCGKMELEMTAKAFVKKTELDDSED